MLASVTATPSATPSTHPPLAVVATLTFPGVTAATVGNATTAALLRAGCACAANVSIADVTLVRVADANTTLAAATLTAANDAVPADSVTCMVATRRLLRTAAGGGLPGAPSGVARALLSAGATTNVTLAVAIVDCASAAACAANAANVADALTRAAAAMLTGSGALFAGLAPFAAAAGGVDLTATVVAAQPAVTVAPSPPADDGGGGGAPSTLALALGVGLGVGAAFALIAAVAVLVWRARVQRKPSPVTTIHGGVRTAA